MKKLLVIFLFVLSVQAFSQNYVYRIGKSASIFLDAGSDITITTLDSIALIATYKNVDSLVWRTDGTGTITDSTAARTYYKPSEADYLLDSVTISLLGFTMSGKDTIYTEKILVIGLLGILNKHFLPIRTKANDIIYAKQD
jgi:hypothetical protein